MRYLKQTVRQSISKLIVFLRGIIRKNKNYFFHSLLDRVFSSKDNIVFVQIGGCDGQTGDPLYYYLRRYKHKVSGVIVEPVQEYCSELTELHKDNPQIKIHQAALHNSKKSMPFYRPDYKKINGAPDFIKATASFNKHHITRYNIPESDIINEKVDCISLRELIDYYGLKNVDILQIDAEGYDSQIILNIDFDTFKPAILHFEHGFGDDIMTAQDLGDIVKLLNSHNYDIYIEDFDVTAFERGIF